MSDLAGTWKISIISLLGGVDGTLELTVDGTRITGTARNDRGGITLREGTVDGDTATIPIELTQPIPLHATARITATGDTLNGKVSGAPIPGVPISGTRVR